MSVSICEKCPPRCPVLQHGQAMRSAYVAGTAGEVRSVEGHRWQAKQTAVTKAPRKLEPDTGTGSLRVERVHFLSHRPLVARARWQANESEKWMRKSQNKWVGKAGQGRESEEERASSHTFPDLHMHGVACIHTQTNKGKNLKATETVSMTEVTEMEGIIPL